jgi:hypothetical protein
MFKMSEQYHPSEEGESSQYLGNQGDVEYGGKRDDGGNINQAFGMVPLEIKLGSERDLDEAKSNNIAVSIVHRAESSLTGKLLKTALLISTWIVMVNHALAHLLTPSLTHSSTLLLTHT